MAGVKKDIKITLKEVIKETSDIYTFVFDKPGNFNWKPGQHGVFKFKNKKVEEGKDFRIFSFACVDKEDMIVLSTRIVDEPSEFKEKLLELKPGDEMTVDGPMGKFTLDDLNKPVLIMAGGIGITPIRAFVKYLDIKDITPKDLTIFYSDDRGEFAYEELLHKLNEEREGLKIVFISDREVFTDKIDEYAKERGNDSLYYISGTPGMVNFLTEKLEGFDIKEDNLVTDTFRGYDE